MAFAVLCGFMDQVVAQPYEKVLDDVKAGLVKLSCKEPGEWTFGLSCERDADGVEILRVKLSAAQPAVPPKFSVELRFPAVDVPHLWKPEYNYDGVRPNWTSGDCRPSETSYAWWTPVYCLHNATDRNRFTFATSECVRPVGFRPCITEETLFAFLRFSFFREPEEPLMSYETAIRLDRRDVFYADAIREASDWILSERKEKPCVSPCAAFEPLYSSWYSFHQNVFDKDIEAECAEAAKLGMKVLIVDDGWQTDDTSRGYAFCGDWQISKRRFPDMKAHVAKVHALGMKYMVWFSMPSIGVKSANYARFKGKYLREEPGREATLDPRFPEVREFLAGVYEKALREWDIDGFKLDFINSFCLFGEKDPAIAEDYAGRDIRSIHEAIDRLVSDVTRRLKAIKPDILVEFRQTYMGPAVRKYGNMFRVADCCGMFTANRAGIAALRLTSGDNAVHSDMIAWHPSETPEQASRQILNSLFGTIQYSMMLRTVPENHKRMMQHWIRFSNDHKEALQHGTFRPYHPEHQYPVLEGEGKTERIIGVYADAMVADCGMPDKTVYVLNATGSGRVLLNLSFAPAAVRAFDTFGRPAPTPSLAAGLNAAAVPEGGYLVFTADPTSVLAETARWQTAIDRMSAAGGGVVKMPSGRHVVGSLFLKSGVTLELEKGCVLEGSTNIADYADIHLKYAEIREPWQALVAAENQQDISVVGEGEIFGNGRDFPYDARLGRPRGMLFHRCGNVRVEGVTMRDLASWTCYYKECDGVVHRRVTVDSHANGNADGVDIESRNVLVDGCVIDCDDDGIVLKSDNPDFLVENVEVRNCEVRSCCSLFKLGTASHGGFRNIRYHDLTGGAAKREVVDPKTGNGYLSDYRAQTWPGATVKPAPISAIAVEGVDGGLLEDISFKNIEVREATCPIFIRGGLRYGRKFGDAVDLGIPFGTAKTVRNVTLENIRIKAKSYTSSSITGVPGLRLKGIALRNVEIEVPGADEAGKAEIGKAVPEKADAYPESNMFDGRMLPAYGFFVRHADDVCFENVRVKTLGREFRQEIVAEDVNWKSEN